MSTHTQMTATTIRSSCSIMWTQKSASPSASMGEASANSRVSQPSAKRVAAPIVMPCPRPARRQSFARPAA